MQKNKNTINRSLKNKKAQPKFVARLSKPSRMTVTIAIVVLFSALFAYVAAVRYQVGNSNAGSAALPFDLPSNATLKGSPKKVFAHYFTPYPISLDNKAATTDYYTNGYLNPAGESGKHAAYGGLLRDRPLARAPIASNYQLEDMKTEIRRASEAGLDGFTVDMLGLSGTHWDRLKLLLQAAPQVDGNFKIMLMPDSNSGATNDAAALAASIASIANSPAVYKLSDGRLVVSPFYPEKRGAAYWQNFISIMKNQYGITVAFVPCFLNYNANAAAFAPFSYGFSNWGNRSPALNASLASNIADAHAKGKIWMQPVSVQDSRPNQGIYDEANNTENLRVTWNAAIANNAEWVQIPTWNDFSEGAQISPSANNNWGPLDISSYYLTRYKTGTWPTIKRDVLYVSHRKQPAAAKPTGGQTKLMTLRGGSSPARDTVEVLSVLPAAGNITVKVGASSYSYSAPAGLSSKTYPLSSGTVYASLSRNNALATDVTSPFAITTSPVVQNLQYHFVVSSRDGKQYAAPAQPVTPAPAPSTPAPSPTPPANPDPVTAPAPPADSPDPVAVITPGTVTEEPIKVSGGDIVINPTTPSDTVKVSVNGKVQPTNIVNTTNLTNGKHTIEIEENGVVTKQEIEVTNPLPRAALNEVKDKPVVFGSGFAAVVASLGVAIRWALIGKFFF